MAIDTGDPEPSGEPEIIPHTRFAQCGLCVCSAPQLAFRQSRPPLRFNPNHPMCQTCPALPRPAAANALRSVRRPEGLNKPHLLVHPVYSPGQGAKPPPESVPCSDNFNLRLF
jgi:hypothetical protein